MVKEKAKKPAGAGGAKKVLVVEDDQFLARALTSKLKKEGFDVQTVRSGQAALDALKKAVPDIMLLDLIMPGKDGFAVLEEVRADKKLKQLRIMVLSNLSQAPDTAATKKFGVLEHLVKADTPLSTIVKRVAHHVK